MQESLVNPIEDYFKESATLLVSSTISWTSSPRRKVADFDVCTLYVYPANGESDDASQSADEANVVLIIYAMVNTASILDLKRNISTIERLRQQGLTVYLMEWKVPESESAQRTLGMVEYLDKSLHRCVQKIRSDCQLDKLNLMGVCQGGVFSLCYASMFPEHVRAVIPVVTPVNFHTEHDTLSSLARHLNLELLMQTGMNVPGVLLAQVFLSLKPMALTVQKYLNIAERIDLNKNTELSETFMAMEQWIDKTPDQPAQFFKEFVGQFYQENALYDGSLRLGERSVDLKKLEMPVLNIYASKDHLVPPDSSKALATLVPKENYQSLEVVTGHIGMFVSQKSLGHVPKAIAEFIRQV